MSTIRQTTSIPEPELTEWDKAWIADIQDVVPTVRRGSDPAEDRKGAKERIQTWLQEATKK